MPSKKDSSSSGNSNNNVSDNTSFLVGVASGVLSSIVTASLLIYVNNRKGLKVPQDNNDNDGSNNAEQEINETSQTIKPAIYPNQETIPLPRAGKVSFNLNSDYDNIYEKHGPKPFQFNYEVVRVFDDMISRSVPFYRECMITLVHWIAHYYQSGTDIYDLGCSTGTTIDVIAQSFLHPKDSDSNSDSPMSMFFVGIDNSQAMIETAREKLNWIASSTLPDEPSKNSVKLLQQDLMDTKISNASIVIMNYTLQFIPVSKRRSVLQNIYHGLKANGILYLSEKVRSDNVYFQETCTQIYEDFKFQRGYSKTEIARKKEALMNVLVPYTEEELMGMLREVGFTYAQVIVKWNNFTTIVAIKMKPFKKNRTAFKTQKSSNPSSDSENLESLFNAQPLYLNLIADENDAKKKATIQQLLVYREDFFQRNLKRAASNYESAAKLLNELPSFQTNFWIDNDSTLCIGQPSEFSSSSDKEKLQQFLVQMKPWKKGPLNLFGTFIDTEWRSDWKWNRIKKHVDSLDGHVVADLGCANGYFMYRMLADYDPKCIVGIDPNYKAWLEFLFFQKYVQSDKLVFELMDGECMDKYSGMYDTVFCLGVLYHTTDPIGMLRKIWQSMKPNGQLIVDCQGIAGDDAVALFPKGKYSNAKGIWFLPTVTTLKNWLVRSNFAKIEVFFSEPLSTEEQRANPEWANVKSLNDALDPTDKARTVEGYPAPHRFYVKCNRG